MIDPALINLEAEASLLGAMMIDHGIADQFIDIVKVDHFAEPVHARLFEVIVRERNLNKSINPILLKPFFENDEGFKALGGVGYLARLTSDSFGLLAPGGLVHQLGDLAARRRMAAGLAHVIAGCKDFSVDLADLVTLADAAIASDADDDIVQMTASEAIDRALSSMGQDRSGVACEVIGCLDNAMGALRPGNLMILAARPGMGKTAVALSYAIGAAKCGHGVLFLSMEMSASELGERMIADLCFGGDQGVPFGAIRSGELNAWQMRRAREASSVAHSLPIVIADKGSVTTGRMSRLIRTYARRMQAHGQKLDLVVVDYLQLLRPDAETRSQYEAISEVSRALKAMAKDHGVAIMALAQLSRTVESRTDKRPQLSDLRDSGQIEQDADVVVFLLREEYYLRQAEPAETDPKRIDWEQALETVRGQIEFIVAKCRNGVAGSTQGLFHASYQAVRG